MSAWFGLLSLMVLGAAWVATGSVRGYARQRLIDLPNARSSHSTPTPRGGGVGVVLAHWSGVGVAGAVGWIAPEVVWVLIGAGGLVALVGFIDDHGHVPAALRLGIHVAAFGGCGYWLGGLPPVEFGFGPVDLQLAGTVLLALYCVWQLNLFNFMDGIDGIAGTHAVASFLGATALMLWQGAPLVASLPLVLAAAATLGFLVWNWPPARIFMGDAGSGYLGFALGALGWWTVVEGWLSPWVWLILGGTFLADATVTLMRRAAAGARLADAHRSHAYQRLSRHWGGHRPVTLAVLALDLGWCLPWALAATVWPRGGALFAGAALLPLFLLAHRLGAGQPGDLPARG